MFYSYPNKMYKLCTKCQLPKNVVVKKMQVNMQCIFQSKNVKFCFLTQSQLEPIMQSAAQRRFVTANFDTSYKRDVGKLWNKES